MLININIEHDDALATIEVHPAQKLLRLSWKGNATGDHYRTVLLRILELVRAQDIKLWLSDGRRMGPILYDDQHWSMNEFTPMVLAAGLERIAIVSSTDAQNVRSVDEMVKATPKEASYDIAFFEDPSIAQLWLMESVGSRVGNTPN